MPKYEVWKLTVVKFVQDIEADNEEEAVNIALDSGAWEVYADHDSIEVFEKEDN